jgi:hypothetical protein
MRSLVLEDTRRLAWHDVGCAMVRPTIPASLDLVAVGEVA